MNSAAATAYTLYAIATTAAHPAVSSAVATDASSSLPTAPDWHAFSTTTGTLPSASTAATFDAPTWSLPPPGFSNASTPSPAPVIIAGRPPATAAPAERPGITP